MISCTEFIPAYSELFSYLESTRGREEVDTFWDYLFQPTGQGNPLINFVSKEGIRGCFSYWAGTLNEEAADFTMYLNEKSGWFLLEMHRCPSKGRLLKLKEKMGLTPYHDYCLHCDCYRYAIEKVGLGYIYNFSGTDHAACSILIYDPKIFDGRVIVGADTTIMDRRAGDNEYFHPGFHRSLNRGVDYLGSNYGFAAVEDYLTQYTKHVYHPIIADIKARGLKALAEKIRDTYEKEHAPQVLTMELTGNCLSVQISACPGVTYLKEAGYKVSCWYRYTTETVMGTLAEAAGLGFTMESYDEETGAAAYCFRSK